MFRLLDLQHVHVYSDPENFCAETSVVNLGNGELVATVAQNRGLVHTDTGSILLVRSLDNGKTWDPDSKVVVLPQEDDAGYAIAALCRLSDGTLLADASCWRHLDSGRIDFRFGQSEAEVYVTRSADKGLTWSPPRRVDMAPMRSGNVRDSVLELPNGKLLMPLGWGFQFQRPLPVAGGPESSRSFVLWSPDRGDTWYYWGTIGFDPAGIVNYDEVGMVRLRDGRLLGLTRTERFPSPPAHGQQMAPPAGYLYSSLSEDNGMQWSWPRDTGIWGYPADPILLEDGSVLVAYSHRAQPWGVRVAVSADGESWHPEDILTIREYDPAAVAASLAPIPGEPLSARVERGHFYHIGYPTSTLLDDGRVFTGYHVFDEAGLQYVEGAIYRVERG